MNDTMQELARRALDSPHWRWMPGMKAVHRWASDIRIITCDGTSPDPFVVINDDEGPILATVDEYGIMGSFPEGDGSPYAFLPDLTDPATLGCLLHLVREVYGRPNLVVEIRQPGDLGARACVVDPVGSEAWETVSWWIANENPEHAEAAALVQALNPLGQQEASR